MALDPIFKICILASVLVFANSIEAIPSPDSKIDNDRNVFTKLFNKSSEMEQSPMYQLSEEPGYRNLKYKMEDLGLNRQPNSYYPFQSKAIYKRSSRNFHRKRSMGEECPCAAAVQANFAQSIAMSLLDSFTSDDFNIIYANTPRSSDSVRADIVRDLMDVLMDKLTPVDQKLFQTKLLNIKKRSPTASSNEDSASADVDTDDTEEDTLASEKSEDLNEPEVSEDDDSEENIGGSTSDVPQDEEEGDINSDAESDLENKIPTTDQEGPLDENEELEDGIEEPAEPINGSEEPIEDNDVLTDDDEPLEDDNREPIGEPDDLENSNVDDDESISDNTIDQTEEEPQGSPTKEVDDTLEDDELNEEQNLNEQKPSMQQESLTDNSQLANQLGTDTVSSQPLEDLDVQPEDTDNSLNKKKRKKRKRQKKRRKKRRKRKRYPQKNIGNGLSILHYGTPEDFHKTKRPQWPNIPNDLEPSFQKFPGQHFNENTFKRKRPKRKKGNQTGYVHNQPEYSRIPNLTNRPQYMPHPTFPQYGSDDINLNPLQSPQQAVLPQDNVGSLIKNRKPKKRKKKKKKYRPQKGSLDNISQSGDSNSPDSLMEMPPHGNLDLNMLPSQIPEELGIQSEDDNSIMKKKRKKRKKRRNKKNKTAYPEEEAGADLAALNYETPEELFQQTPGQPIDAFGGSINRTKRPQWPNVNGQGFNDYDHRRRKPKRKKGKKTSSQEYTGISSIGNKVQYIPHINQSPGGPQDTMYENEPYDEYTNPSGFPQNGNDGKDINIFPQPQQINLPEDNIIVSEDGNRLKKKKKHKKWQKLGALKKKPTNLSQSRQPYYGLPSNSVPLGALSDGDSPDSYTPPPQATEILNAQPDSVREMKEKDGNPQEQISVDSNNLHHKTPEGLVHQVANQPGEGLDMIKGPQPPDLESPFQTAATPVGEEFDDNTYMKKRPKMQNREKDTEQSDHLSTSPEYPGISNNLNNQPQYIIQKGERPYGTKQDNGVNFNIKRRKRPKRKHKKKWRKKRGRLKKNKNRYWQSQGIGLQADSDDNLGFAEDGRLTKNNEEAVPDFSQYPDQSEYEIYGPENSYVEDELDPNLLPINKESFENFLELAVQPLQNVSRSDLLRIIPQDLLSKLMTKPNSILTNLLNDVLIKLQDVGHKNEPHAVPTLLLTALHNWPQNDFIQELRNPPKYKKIKLRKPKLNQAIGTINNEEIAYKTDSELKKQKGQQIDIDNDYKLTETKKARNGSKVELLYEDVLHMKEKEKPNIPGDDIHHHALHDSIDSKLTEAKKAHGGSKFQIIHQNSLRRKRRKKRVKKKKGTGIKDLIKYEADNELPGTIEDKEKSDSDLDHIDLHTDSELSQTTKMSKGSKVELMHENALQNKKKKKESMGAKDLLSNETPVSIENEEQADSDLEYIDLNTDSELSETTKMSRGSKVKLVQENALQKRKKKKKGTGDNDLIQNETGNKLPLTIENEEQADSDLDYIDLNTDSELSETTKMSTGSKVELIHENALEKRKKKKKGTGDNDLLQNEIGSELPLPIQNDEEQADSDLGYVDLDTDSELSETTKMSRGSKVKLIHENALQKRKKKKKGTGGNNLLQSETGSELALAIQNDEEQADSDLDYLDLNTDAELSETTKMSRESKVQFIHENALQKRKKKKKGTGVPIENEEQAYSDFEYFDLNTDSELSETTKTSKRSKVKSLNESALQTKGRKKAILGSETNYKQKKEMVNQAYNRNKFEFVYEDALQVFEKKKAHGGDRNYENVNAHDNSNISEMKKTFGGSKLDILYEDTLQTKKKFKNSERGNINLKIRDTNTLGIFGNIAQVPYKNTLRRKKAKKSYKNSDRVDIEADYELSETKKTSDESKMEIMYEDALEVKTQKKSAEDDLEIFKDIDFESNSEMSESKEVHNGNQIELIYEDGLLVKHATKPQRDIGASPSQLTLASDDGGEGPDQEDLNNMYRNARPLLYRKKQRKFMKSGRGFNLKDFRYRGSEVNQFSAGGAVNYIPSNDQGNLPIIEENADYVECNDTENEMDVNSDKPTNNGKFIRHGQNPTPQPGLLTQRPHYTNVKRVEDYFSSYKIPQKVVKTNMSSKPLLNQLLDGKDEDPFVYKGGKIKIIG